MECCASPIDVVARYSEGVWPDDDLTWIQYLQERANNSPAGEETPGRGTSQAIYNPYDYKDPSSQPHDMKDSPPFSQHYDEMGAEYGRVYQPEVLYHDDAILKDWYKARRRDWTDDPTEQNPAISIDRRYASMGVEAASLKEVMVRDTHRTHGGKMGQVGSLGIRPIGNTQDSMLKGLFQFTWNSKNTDQPKVVLQFLRPKGNRRPGSYLDYPVQMACNCASFLWYGAQYYAVHGKYMYMPMFRPSLVPPIPETMISRVSRGKGLNFTMCKHLMAAYDWFDKQNLRILMHYRRYPTMGPPSKKMNPKVWEQLMGFPFELEEIKRRLSSRKPALPRFFSTNFFRNREQSYQMDQWFRETWLNRDESAKIRVLETLVEHPEEIFYLLVKDAMEASPKLSQTGIEKAYDIMSRVIQPDNDKEPSEDEEEGTPGTGVVIPKSDEDKPAEPDKPVDESTYKKVEPAVGEVEPAVEEEEKGMERFSPDKKVPKKKKEKLKLWEEDSEYVPPLARKQRQIAKKLRPWLTRSALDNVIDTYIKCVG